MSISIISFIVALFVLTFLVVLLLKQKSRPVQRVYNSSNDEGAKKNNLNEGLVQSKWAEIMIMQKSGPSGLKSALMEADKLLDYCMIGKGFKGDTMGDRLKSGGSKFKNLNAVWSAHKLRNELAHNVEHDLVPAQINQAISNLGDAIKDLGVRI
jgi:hypothetical protein